MKSSRRQFLSSVVASTSTMAATNLVAQNTPAGTEKVAARVDACLIADPRRHWNIVDIFRELGLVFRVLRPEEIAAVMPEQVSLLWLAASSYPQPTELSAALSAKVDEFLRAGKGVMAEFVTNFPGLPESRTIQKTGVARLFVNEPLDVPDALPARTILEEHDSVCLEMTAYRGDLKEVLSYGRVVGVQQVPAGFKPKETWPGLLWGERGCGRFALAATSISEFRRRQYAPLVHWEKFMRELALALLPEARREEVLRNYLPLRLYSEPRVWVLPGQPFRVVVETAPGAKVRIVSPQPKVLASTTETRHEADWKVGQTGPWRLTLEVTRDGARRTAILPIRVASRKAAYLRALERNIRWFERSGALIKPDGSLGVTEWVSAPDTDGIRIPYACEQQLSPERADCLCHSAMAFWYYGKVAGSRRHQQIAENMLVRNMDFQRLERGDPGRGLWLTRGRGGQAFQDDTSWATVCALAGYRYMKNPMFLDRGLLSAEAQARAFGPDDKLRVPLYAKRPWWQSSDEVLMTSKVNMHPHIGGCVVSAWLYTYGMTGDKRYLEMSLPPLREMVEEFPKLPEYVISRSCEAARFLLPLALACAYSPDPYLKDALRQQAEFLRSRMDRSGAIREEGSNIRDRVEGGDLGLTYEDTDTIADLMYCVSFAAMNFWIAYKAIGEQAYLDDFFRVTDFLVRVQVDSSDPMTDGGWMRGFDFSLWEYYGANADQAWSAYCMETGWLNAVIDMALGLYLTDDTFYAPRSL